MTQHGRLRSNGCRNGSFGNTMSEKDWGDSSLGTRADGRQTQRPQHRRGCGCGTRSECFPKAKLSGSSVSTHRLLASNQTALRPRHRSPPSESTTLPCRTRPRKQPREAATLGWEYRSQQVRRRRVSGAQGER